MSIINANPLLAAAGGDYQISRSVRLRSSASAYLNRTPASNGNATTWTLNAWGKRGQLGTTQIIFGSGNGTTVGTYIQFNSSDQLEIYYYSSTYIWRFITTAVYRDPSAWYDIFLAYDSGNATAGNRLRLYVNGSQVTSFGTSSTISLNQNTSINSNSYPHYISATGAYYDGYLTEINFIDGQALTPSSFGETDSITGVWKPKKYAGTYGTNGFYLNFSDNSNNTAATIGKDSSGNGNNWTPNNISVTSGVTYDSMLDTPTPYADGGNGRGNYAVWNPLDKRVSGTSTFANGNLDATVGASASTEEASATITFPSSGSWYCEITCSNVASGNARIGIGNSATAIDSRPASGYLYQQDGQKYVLGTASAYGASYTTGDVIGVAFDASSGSITFYKNNTSQGSITGISTSSIWVITATGKATVWIANFGQRPFSYTPPTGFKALNTQNLPDSTIKKGNQYFDASLWTGNGTGQTIVNAGAFAPDLVWIKDRTSGTNNPRLLDTSRGATKELYSSLTNAEATDAGSVTSFNSNGFTVGNSVGVNANTNAVVGWQWKKGATQGFDIVTWTGTGANRTIAHSLGVAPKMIIAKHKDAVDNWIVYHASLGGSPDYLWLNLTSAKGTSSAVWNTAPTSSVFGVGTDNLTNLSGGSYVGYLFAEVAGFSKFGSYTGNGSTDGPFVYCGFRPRFVLVKCSSNSTASTVWTIWDTSRNTYNASVNELYPNSSSAEFVDSSGIDILSNGFKPKRNSEYANLSGWTYVYAAFAENPFKNSLAR